LPERAMMTLNKPLAVTGVIALGLVLAGISATRHTEDKAQPAVKPHQAATEAHPQVSGGQPAPAAQAADHSFPASPPPHQVQRTAAMPPYGYPTAPDGYMPGDMSRSIYGSLNADDGPGPTVYWAPGRWYPYPGFGDKRVFMPPPEGVWGR
jgi:hypothetical protein